MNRKKTIDYTVTRRPRDSYSQLNSSKSRTDSRDQRGRGGDDRDKKPFWSKDDKKLGNDSKYNTFQRADQREENLYRDALLKDLQEEISRSVLSQDSLSLSGRANKDSYSREEIRGPIIDEFSEDAYHHSNMNSNRMDYRDNRDQQRRRDDDSLSWKRSYSPLDDKSSSYRNSRENTTSKHSRITNLDSHHDVEDDDLRNVLKQYQKSKWDDDEIASKDKKRYDSKDSGSGKGDRKRSKDSRGMSSSSDVFTMTSQGALASLPLEPLTDSTEYFESSFRGDYREKDHQKGDKQSYRDSRESRDYSRSRYNPSGQDRRGSLDDEQRSSDLDKRDSRYRMGNRDSGNDAEIGHLLHQYRDSSNFESSSLSSDTLRDLSVTELAQKAGEKYKTGFELGRPFFGFRQDQQRKEQGWQDPAFGGEPNRDNIWKESGDLLLDQRDESYRDNFDNDDLLLQPDRKDQVGGKFSSSKAEQRDGKGSSYFKDSKNNNSGQRGSLGAGFKPLKSGPMSLGKMPGGSSSSFSNPATSKTGIKPLFPAGFMPRQVKMPFGTNIQKGGVNKGKESPPLLQRKTGYFPRNTDTISRSRSRSSERADDKNEFGSSSGSKTEVKPPSKGKFTTQNWFGLESNDNKGEAKENVSLQNPQVLGSTGGRGSILTNERGNRGRGGIQQKPGRGRAGANANNRGRGGRGAGFTQRGRGRGRGRGNRGRGFSLRGRGFALRGRGRGLSQPPVGATVRNIFRRSKSLSPAEGKCRRSSRSPGSPRRSRSRRRSSRSRSRSRSRSSSYCSSCSSCSCSSCHSWRSISVDSLKGVKDHKRHGHHREKNARKEEMEKKSGKTLDKLKSDIKDMEKKLEQKKVKDVSVKKPSEKKPSEKTPSDRKPSEKTPSDRKPSDKRQLDKKPFEKKPLEQKPSDKNSAQKYSKDVSKSILDVKATINVSKATIKEETKGGKLKDQKSSLKNLSVKEEKSKSPFDAKKEFKKKTDNSREVILKSDKRKESPLVIKKEKKSPAREVKIVSEKKSRGDKVLDEKSTSKMNVDSLKITIDQPKWLSEATKSRKSDMEDEITFNERKKSSKSPPGKQKKKDKEKVKTKKAKKKSKKRKHDRGSDDSGDESVYSSISGQDEFFSSNDDKSKYMQPVYDERIVEFSSGTYDSNKITVHYAKRNGTVSNHPDIRKLSEEEAPKSTPSRANLITIPMSTEPNYYQGSSISRKVRGAPPPPPPPPPLSSLPPQEKGFDDDSSDALYSEMSYTGNDSNVDWETAKFAGEFHTEGVHSVQDYGSSYQSGENLEQEWVQGQEEAGEYYFGEGAEGEGYEQEYYPQQGDQAGAGDVQEGEYYQEWYEGEYAQEGAEGETAGAEYEGQYYLGEDGLYYPVEGEAYEEYQGEFVEGGVEGEVVDPGQGASHVEEGYGYQYDEEGHQYTEGAEWQQYEDGSTYQAEEGWGQGEVEGQWGEFQEGYPAAEGEWSTEYTQGNEYEAAGQEYATDRAEALPQEGYNASEGYDQNQYYMESYQSVAEGHNVEQNFEPQQQEEEQEQVQEPVTVKHNSKGMPVSDSKDNTEETKPLKSILKKANQTENKRTKLVSERLAQMKKQPTSKVETPWLGNTSASSSSSQTVQKTEQNQQQEEAASVQSESDRYREIEEEILSSQPKDAIGTEYVVRVHGSGTANFYCKLCNCRFNTLTAKNLHIKGMKHIELYIRLKSQLLQSVIKDTKAETPKRPAEEDAPGARKVPRVFN